MAFSTQVRREIVRVPVEKKCCARAEIAAVCMGAGVLSFQGKGKYGLVLYAASREIATRYIDLLHRFYHIPAALQSVETTRLGGTIRYAVRPQDGEVSDLLKSLHLIDPAMPFGLRNSPDHSILQEACCKVSFLRGAYLVGGSTGNPEKAYHMEIAVSNSSLAEYMRELLEEMEIPAKVMERKSQWVTYVKDADHMGQLLAILGANRSYLELENLRILKDIRNEANRQANCDNANLDKTIAAAEKQISIIETIDKKMGLENLSPALEEIARLRLQYPEVSLTELGTMTTPAIGKSGVNARMRKLEMIAEDLINS